MMPPDQRRLLTPMVDTVQGVARNLGVSMAPFFDALTATTRRALARKLSGILDATQSRLGLPATGCARTRVRNVVQRGPQSGEHPFEAFKNVYGEDALGGCLRSMVQPYYDRVDLLTDQNARFGVLSARLRELDASNYVTDVLIDLHGCGDPQGAASPNRSAECGGRGLLFSSPNPASAGGERISPETLQTIRPTLVEMARSISPTPRRGWRGPPAGR